MANAVINALFTAQETISDALHNAELSIESLDSSLDQLNGAFGNAKRYINEGEQELDEFRNAAKAVEENSEILNRRLSSLSNKFVELSQSENITERQMDEFTSAVRKANVQSQTAEESVESLVGSFFQLSSVSDLSEAQLDALGRSVNDLSQSTYAASTGVDSINQAMVALYGAAKAADSAVNDVGRSVTAEGAASAASSGPNYLLARALDSVKDEADGASNQVKSLTGDLALLNTIASSTAFRFSSLSVNIGPFNLALKNILTQLPAILTGMSTMLALVTSLATAFVTLGLVSGALIAGGALAFFEDFAAQFEESAEAAEALMGALRDLFMEALAPITDNEANMDLFINFIDNAAALVNRFAQFVEQMRGDVLSFLDTIDVDIDTIFEAMHDSFVIMQPILRGFIEFFLTEVPKIIVRFSQLSREISGDISMMLSAFGGLIDQLLDFASVLLDVLAPAIVTIVGFLTALFRTFNSIPDIIADGIIAITALSLGVTILIVKFASLAHSIMLVHRGMVSQAAAGSILSAVYSTLYSNVLLLLAGKQSLLGVLAATKANLQKNIVMWLANASMKMKNMLATNALSTAMIFQLDLIAALIAGNKSLTEVLVLTAGNIYRLVSAIFASIAAKLKSIAVTIASTIAMYGFAGAAGVAATAVWSLVAGLLSLATPILIIIGIIGGLVGLFHLLSDLNIFAAAINGAKTLIGWIKDLLQKLHLLPTFDADVSGGDIDVANTDDISTEAGVNLSFEEAIENNVDVQADPEDTAGLTRITKDALEEANSLARRRQGSQ